MKRFIAYTLVALLIIGILPVEIYADTALSVNSKGIYLISSADDFNKITDMNGTYWIVKDIELSEDFSPIGTPDNPFKGKITGRLDEKNVKPTLTVNISGIGYQGLISTLNGGQVSNLIIKGRITADKRTIAGSVVGYVKNGKIDNVINYAEIKSTYTGSDNVYVGGIAGFVEAPSAFTVSNCINYGNIVCETASNGSAGGIVGGIYTSRAEIFDCKNEGSINTTLKKAGGICGVSRSDIKGCVNIGKVISKNGNSAGICADTNNKTSFSFNTGDITAKETAVGLSFGECFVCYNTGNITGYKVNGISCVASSRSYNVGKISGTKEQYVIAPKRDGYNYSLVESILEKDVKILKEKDFTLLENFEGFQGYYKVDEEGEYKYPQILENKFGTVEKEYTPFDHNRIAINAEDLEISQGVYQIRSSTIEKDTTVLYPVKTITDVTLIEKPAISYQFYAPENGKHCVWIRGYAANGSSDSIWVAFDNDEYQNAPITVDDGKYLWTRILTKEIEKGVHTVDIYPREYAEVDRIVITNKTTVTPSGTGEYVEGQGEELLYKLPEIKPTSGHPRVWFSKEDIPKIREELNHPEKQAAWNIVKSYIDKEITGELKNPEKYNFQDSQFEIVKAYAFDYVINGNAEKGEKAILVLKNLLDTLNLVSETYYKQAGEVVYAIALVYDWCFDLLSDADKEYFIEQGLFVAGSYTQVGWPPVKQSGWGAHGSENQMLRDMLAFGIATYDEKPYIYNTVVGRLEEEYLPFRRDFFYDAEMSLFGDGYGIYRLKADVAAMYMLAEFNGGKNFWENDNLQYVPYWWIYSQRPDRYSLINGDSQQYNYADPTKQSKEPDFIFSMIGSFYKDGYLIDAFKNAKENMNPTYAIEYLICHDVNIERESMENLPLVKYFPYPAGHYIARTGWNLGKDSPDVLVNMKINETNIMDHNHNDAGGFEIYYKGALATDSGYYQSIREGDPKYENTDTNGKYWVGYYSQTIAHNCITVFDPNESPNNFMQYSKLGINSGGQIATNRNSTVDYPKTVEELKTSKTFNTGKVLGREVGPNEYEPRYTYLKGDIAASYSNKVSEYERSFMFLDFDDGEIPAALIVFDHMVTSNPQFKKTYHLHSVNVPEVNGNRTTILRTENGYNGKLINDTLLPKAENLDIVVPTTDKDEYLVYGNRFYTSQLASGTDEGSAIRTDISPKTANKEDYFLNVMQVSDGDSTVQPLDATLIEAKTHTGVKIKDRVVMFGKTKERIFDKVTFDFDGEETYEISIADLKAGTWKVELNGEELIRSVATEDGGLLVFNGIGGLYTVTYVSDDVERKENAYIPEKVENKIKMTLNNQYIYTDDPPFMENGRVLVPFRAVANGFSADVLYDEASKTVTVTRYGREVKVTADSDTAYIAGNPSKLDVPARIIQDRMYVPLRFIAEAFFSKVAWNNETRTVIMTNNIKPVSSKYIQIVDCEFYGGIQEINSNGYNAFDGNEATAWTTGSAEPDPKWLTLQFAESKEFSTVEILFGSPQLRTFTFDILVSDDNENWTVVKEGLESTLVDTDQSKEYQKFKMPRSVKGKYVKIIAYGNSKTTANNYIEVRFY